MNIMNRVTWRAMWKNRTRTLVTVVGVLLSAAMFMAVCTMGVSMWQFLVRHETQKEGDHFVRFHFANEEALSALQEEKGVTELGISRTLGYSTFHVNNSGSETCVVVAVDDAFLEMAAIDLLEGRFPENSGEIVITENIYYYLRDAGKPCEVGETVTLEIEPKLLGWELPTHGRGFTAQYKIVGIMQRFFKLNGDDFNLSSLLTYADGEQTDALWHTMLLKTFPAQIAMDLSFSESFGTCYYKNTDLMGLYGATVYSNYNAIIGGLCGALLCIILIGSVSLIYNAFSISVSERTRQFGLLSCVGATKGQIRRSVFFEASVLCVLGIPLGIACGYGGICVVLHFVGDEVNYLMQESFESPVTLETVFSAIAAVAAALVGVLAVFLSAWIPARRATAIEPISAIRQSEEYRVPKKAVGYRKLEKKLWGLPGLLAKKYYKTSRSKYRNTVISLTVSVILFLTATSFGAELRRFAQTVVNTENFDILIYWDSGYDILAIRDMELVEQSALIGSNTYGIALQPEQISDAYRELAESSRYEEEEFYAQYAEFTYLEDSVLLEYLLDNGIDPEPYFDSENPTALVCHMSYTFHEQDEAGNITRSNRVFSVVKEDVERVQLFANSFPQEVRQWHGAEMKYSADTVTVDGIRLLRVAPISMGPGIAHMDHGQAQYFEVEPCVIDGITCQRYYPYDLTTKARTGDAICTEEVDIPSIRLGARIAELPYGVPSYGRMSRTSVMFILPLSQMKSGSANLSVSVRDYERFASFIKEQDLNCIDYLQGERTYRVLGVLIDVFANGFILLISLICACNVFNTVSTNIALRRKDLGVLRSVGMKLSEMHRMLGFECLQYGLKALMFGLPLGVAASFGVYWITNSDDNFGFVFPWAATAVAAVSVMMLVFISMLYAISKLGKDNPIEAIRRENI